MSPLDAYVARHRTEMTGPRANESGQTTKGSIYPLRRVPSDQEPAGDPADPREDPSPRPSTIPMRQFIDEPLGVRVERRQRPGHRALTQLRHIVVHRDTSPDTWASASEELVQLAVRDEHRYGRRAELALAVADALLFTRSEDVTEPGFEPLVLALRALRHPFISDDIEDQVMGSFFSHGWTVDAVLEESDLAEWDVPAGD